MTAAPVDNGGDFVWWNPTTWDMGEIGDDFHWPWDAPSTKASNEPVTLSGYSDWINGEIEKSERSRRLRWIVGGVAVLVLFIFARKKKWV